jgi:TolB protein
MNADGSNQVNLTDSTADEGSPAWSPDGKYYSSIPIATATGDIPHGTPTAATRPLSNDPGSDRAAAWSGMASSIIFLQTDRDGNKEIYIMNADGSNQTNIHHEQD